VQELNLNGKYPLLKKDLTLVDNNLKYNKMAESVKTLQDFLKEYPDNKAEAVKQYLIYIKKFGGSFRN
jgi:hypothetical protein